VRAHAIWHELAVEEFLAAVKWYEDQRRGLGTEFELTCRAAIALIEQHPLSFPIVHSEIRRVVLRRFPYSIFYRARESETVIVAVMHERRDPRRWRSRR
jgi:plasmid stabilization system protein ParE